MAGTAQIPRVAWETLVQSGEQDYEMRSAAIAPDGSRIWVAVAARARGARGGAENLLLTSITGTGVQDKQWIDVAGHDAVGALVDRRALQGMASGPDGRIAMAVSRRVGGAALATLDSTSGQIVASRPLSFEGPAPDIARLVHLTGGRILVIGTVGTRAFLAQIDTAGSVIWQRVLLEEDVNLDDATHTSDGGAVVSGRKGSDPAATRVWVAKISAKGDVQRQAVFSGWLGSIAQGSDGGYLLVTTERGRDVNVTLTGLTAAMDARWTRTMPAGQPNTPSFRVAAVPGGDFVVAGVKDRGLWLSRIGKGGAAVWTESRPPKPPAVEVALNVELFRRDDAFFVLYTAFAVEGREQRQLVHVIRFSA